MKPFVIYSLCPECGRSNTEQKRDCPECGLKLFSEDEAGHQRYMAHLRAGKRGSLIQVACVTAVLGFFVARPIFWPMKGVPYDPLILWVEGIVGFGFLTVNTFFRLRRYRRLKRFLERESSVPASAAQG